MTFTVVKDQDRTGSGVIVALEALYGAVQERHPELPDVVLITGSGREARRKGLRLGHFRPGAWRERAQAEAAGVAARRPELFIAGETLAMGPEEVLCTVLHEAAHGLAAVREIKDTSKEGRYHNKHFRAIAAELGLVHPTGKPDRIHGFSDVHLTPETTDSYTAELEALAAAVALELDVIHPGAGPAGDPDHEGDEGDAEDQDEEPAKKSRANLKAVCACDEPRIIRASRAVLDGPDIWCAECEQPFEPVDERDESAEAVHSANFG